MKRTAYVHFVEDAPRHGAESGMCGLVQDDDEWELENICFSKDANVCTNAPV